MISASAFPMAGTRLAPQSSVNRKKTGKVSRAGEILKFSCGLWRLRATSAIFSGQGALSGGQGGPKSAEFGRM